MGNLLAPFWVVVAAGIARIDFREIFGHLVVFAALWFVVGVSIFTFVEVTAAGALAMAGVALGQLHRSTPGQPRQFLAPYPAVAYIAGARRMPWPKANCSTCLT
jgi:hypothetical protein